MRSSAAALLIAGVVLGGSGAVLGQAPPALPPASPTPSPAPPAPTAPAPVHRPGELQCQQCHVGKHQGVLHMYLGTGGRGTPMLPSHMFQVRVECVACHVAPKEESARVGLVGQTFRPSEQACLGCHGERYRGMLQRWSSTLGKMQEVVAGKLVAVHAAMPGDNDPKRTRARRLADDAEFNSRFVELGKGVHNVFYAADLLKLANRWLDEASTLLGKAAPQADDALVRGGYCAVLCHATAGVKQKPTVVFQGQRLPHGRHVSEFGAVCTDCHSAEVHKRVTATPATCASCHHGPQNERCEGCHRVQAAFYRGQTETTLVKLQPNVMADAVPCTGCHDFARKHSRQAVGTKCLGCHERPYLALLQEWTVGFDQDAGRSAAAIKAAEGRLRAVQRGGRPPGEADSLLQEARSALALVRRARGAHNPEAADALLELARRKAEAAAPTPVSR